MLSEYSKQADPDVRDEKYTYDDPPGNTGNLNLRSEFPEISGGIPDNPSFTDPTASNITLTLSPPVEADTAHHCRSQINFTRGYVPAHTNECFDKEIQLFHFLKFVCVQRSNVFGN